MDALDRRALRGSIVGNAVFFALIFGPAGTLDYWQGWTFFLTLAISTALVTLYMARHDRQLLERRLRMGPKAEKAQIQKIILGVSAAIYPIAFIIMVLDHRFGWSPSVPACHRQESQPETLSAAPAAIRQNQRLNASRRR